MDVRSECSERVGGWRPLCTSQHCLSALRYLEGYYYGVLTCILVYALYALAEYIAVGTNIYFNYHMSLMVGEGQRLYLSFDVDKPKTTTQ